MNNLVTFVLPVFHDFQGLQRHTLTLDMLSLHRNHPEQRPADAVKRLIAEIVERVVGLKGPQVHQQLHL